MKKKICEICTDNASSALAGLIVIILTILGIIGLFVLVSFIGAWLWNITLPYIFGLPVVEWWHIGALIILLWIILPVGKGTKEGIIKFRRKKK